MHVKRRGRTSVNAIDAGPRCDRESGGAIYNIIRSKNTMRVDIFRRRCFANKVLANKARNAQAGRAI